jgi:hypothetical protein
MSITRVAVSHTQLAEAEDAGRFLANEVLVKLGGVNPDLMIVFASPVFEFSELLAAIDDVCQPGVLVGCSSAGEFSGCTDATSSVSVLAIKADDMRFNAALGVGLRADHGAVLDQIMPVFTGAQQTEFPYRSAMVLTDALAGHTDQIIDEMTVRTGGTYQLFGGGAADDARFQQTHVFFGRNVHEDALVIVEMLSKRPMGLGIRHGWEPVGEALRVTESEGNRVVSLNATSPAEVFVAHAQRTDQLFKSDDPMPFFLHNVLGIDTGDGYKLRVPLSLNDDGSISFAAAVPSGATVRLMTASSASACDAARLASVAALDGLQGSRHAGSLLFDCAATRLRLGRAFEDELNVVADTLGSPNFAGCNTYGQIARAEGQFSGFHNCTAIVCAIPE